MNTYANDYGDTVTDWQTLRHDVDVTGTRLEERTFKWLATLPSSVRPMVTARQFPHVANRIGELWPHCEFTRLYLQSLVIDRRGGRNGFPAGVKREIEALQQYYFENLSGLPAILWNAVPLVEPRIPRIGFAPVHQRNEIDLHAAPAEAG